MMRTVFRFSVYLVSALLRSLSGGYIQGNRRQGNEINQQTVQFSHHRESLTRFYIQQKTRLWNIFLKNSLVCTKFIDQKLESFRIVYHEIIIIKYYSILRGTKVMRKNHLLSFFPFFFTASEWLWNDRNVSKANSPTVQSRNTTSDEFSKYNSSFARCPLSPRQYGDTLNNIGPDGGHRNVFSAPPFKRRNWKPV